MPLTHVRYGKEHMTERKIKICFWIPYGILKFNTFSYLCSKGFSLLESSYQRAPSKASQEEEKKNSNTFPKDVRCRFSHFLCECRRCCCCWYFAISPNHIICGILSDYYYCKYIISFWVSIARPLHLSLSLARSNGKSVILFASNNSSIFIFDSCFFFFLHPPVPCVSV